MDNIEGIVNPVTSLLEAARQIPFNTAATQHRAKGREFSPNMGGDTLAICSWLVDQLNVLGQSAHMAHEYTPTGDIRRRSVVILENYVDNNVGRGRYVYDADMGMLNPAPIDKLGCYTIESALAGSTVTVNVTKPGVFTIETNMPGIPDKLSQFNFDLSKEALPPDPIAAASCQFRQFIFAILDPSTSTVIKLFYNLSTKTHSTAQVSGSIIERGRPNSAGLHSHVSIIEEVTGVGLEAILSYFGDAHNYYLESSYDSQ